MVAYNTVTRPERVADPDDPRGARWLLTMRTVLDVCRVSMSEAQKQRDLVRQRKTELERQLGDLTADLQSDIALALTENGKPLFSNAESRAAELRRRLGGTGAAQSLQHQLDGCEVQLAEYARQFDAAQRQRQDTLAILAFNAQWLSYWGNQTTE